MRIFYYELFKTFAKKRTYLGFLIVAIIVPLVEVAMKLEGGRFVNAMTRGLQQDFFFVGNLFNGWLVAQQIMMSLWFHVPILIGFVAGDMLAGEATAGTYRLILIRPVSRTAIFYAKYAATVVYTVLFVVMLGALSIGLALILFGTGDLLVIRDGILILPESEAALRFLYAYTIAAISMITLSSIAFFFSSFVENAIGPIVSTMGVLIVFMIIASVPVSLFEAMRPYLFVTYTNAWMKAFQDPIPWDEIRTSLFYLCLYCAGCVGAAHLIFIRKDILS